MAIAVFVLILYWCIHCIRFSISDVHGSSLVGTVWSEKFSASTIDDNNIGKIFFPKLVYLS